MQKLIHNTEANNHFLIIEKLIEQADEIKIAVAFYRSSGWNLLKNKLEKAAKKGCQIDITCGLDFGFSEPKALTDTLQLFSKYPNTNLYFSDNKTTFHPKVYYFKIGQTIHIISGSANFTHGGLVSNSEASLYVIANEKDDINIQTITFFEELKREAASLLKITQYKPYQYIQREFHKGIKENQQEMVNLLTVNYDTLEAFYQTYKKNNDIKAIAEDRIERYRKAKIVLEKMITQKMNKSDFRTEYEKLVGAKGTTQDKYWSSGYLFRNKTEVINRYKQFIELVKIVSNNQAKAPSILFDTAKKQADKINGVGINIFTEILLSFDLKRFPTINKNSIEALEKVGCELPSKSRFKGIHYEEYTNLMTEIRDRFDMKTFTEVDGLLNEIYWEN
jgi:HKD family nuclease